MTCLIRMPEVQRRVGISRVEIYRRIKTGRFPRPVKISQRLVAWVEEEIDAYVADKVMERERSQT